MMRLSRGNCRTLISRMLLGRLATSEEKRHPLFRAIYLHLHPAREAEAGHSLVCSSRTQGEHDEVAYEDDDDQNDEQD